jgi:hypothetical protein
MATLALLVISIPIRAQGSDDCGSTAATITGFGSFAYSTAGATTDTMAACGMVDDVWFRWIASATGQTRMYTCLTGGQDTILALHSGGGCPFPGSLITCDDDSCGGESAISVPLVAGQVYSIEIGTFWPGSAHGLLTILPDPPVGWSICSGVSSSPCPCGISGIAPRGCPNSVESAGAYLSASGSASVAAADLALTAVSLPHGTALFFQGDVALANGAGIAFGDGLRCAGGNVVRFDVVASPGGMAQCPLQGTQPIAVRGGVVPGDVRFYQAWYRDAASFCTSATFNLTNGVRVAWSP